MIRGNFHNFYAMKARFTLPTRHTRSIFSAKCNLNALLYSGFISSTSLTISIIELYAHCKGGNINIHIWAWFGQSGSIYFVKLLSCLSCAKERAFHENPDRHIYKPLE